MAPSIHDIAPQLLFTVVVFCAGLFAGLTVASQLALGATTPLTMPAWAEAVDSMRYVTVACIVTGLAGMVALEFISERAVG